MAGVGWRWQREVENVISLIKSCSKQTHLLQIHSHIVSSSLVSDSAVCLHFLSRSPLRDLSYARKFFDHIATPCLVHYNAIIRAYSASHSALQGLCVYRDMRTRHLHPNAFSSSFALKCCVTVSSLAGGIQVHGLVVRDGHGSDTHLLTSLMEMYSRCRSFADARNVFDEIPHRDSVAWNVLVSCYLRGDRARDALALFGAMRRSRKDGCEPDEVTCLLMLQACSELAALELGERIHGYIEECGFGGRTDLKNALVSMYSRCGCLEKAYRVFRGTRGKDVVSWTAMISGLAMNGQGREAVDAFREMEKTGIPPNEQTFTGVLSACSHCGLVDEGTSLFNRMSAEFGVSRNVHHYGCMVDLLGRAGLVDHAYRLVTSMDVDPDPEMWKTLLGACRIHGRVDLAERAVARLVEIKAEEAGDYVLLLNIYSSLGYWGKVRQVRKLLKDNAILTTPGRSSIEIKGEVHEFISDDFSHPRNDEIYEMLARSTLK